MRNILLWSKVSNADRRIRFLCIYHFKEHIRLLERDILPRRSYTPPNWDRHEPFHPVRRSFRPWEVVLPGRKKNTANLNSNFARFCIFGYTRKTLTMNFWAIFEQKIIVDSYSFEIFLFKIIIRMLIEIRLRHGHDRCAAPGARWQWILYGVVLQHRNHFSFYQFFCLKNEPFAKKKTINEIFRLKKAKKNRIDENYPLKIRQWRIHNRTQYIHVDLDRTRQASLNNLRSPSEFSFIWKNIDAIKFSRLNR